MRLVRLSWCCDLALQNGSACPGLDSWVSLQHRVRRRSSACSGIWADSVVDVNIKLKVWFSLQGRWWVISKMLAWCWATTLQSEIPQVKNLKICVSSDCKSDSNTELVTKKHLRLWFSSGSEIALPALLYSATDQYEWNHFAFIKNTVAVFLLHVTVKQCDRCLTVLCLYLPGRWSSVLVMCYLVIRVTGGQLRAAFVTWFECKVKHTD